MSGADALVLAAEAIMRRINGETPRGGAVGDDQPRACSACGVVQSAEGFYRRAGRSAGRRAACKNCMRRAAVLAGQRQRYPACVALGANGEPGAVLTAARSVGCASGFEAEVAARLQNWGIDFEREACVFRYVDADDTPRRWTPDFAMPAGVVIEAKGLLYEGDAAAIAAVVAQNPSLDLRLVFQYPHQRIAVSGSTMTHAQWADSLDLRWTTLAGLELVTMDLPRVALTHEGDRVFPDARDEAPAASATSPVPDAATAP